MDTVGVSVRASLADQGWRRVEFRPPSFRVADLRLIGGMLPVTLTTVIRYDVIAFCVPIWSDDARQALVVLGERLSDAVAVAMRKGTLPFPDTPDWSSGLSAIESAFELKRRPSLFAAEPSFTWVTFTEPQLTKGLAHFLNADVDDKKTKRIRALLKALGAAELSNDVREITVTAEAPTSGNRRIDLLIEWKDSAEQDYAVAIEAKLGHHVTSGQLPAYRRHLQKIAKERRLLVVVSPQLTSQTDRSLERNRDWRWTSWHDLLVSHERALPVESDDNEYLQFRRILWDHTG